MNMASSGSPCGACKFLRRKCVRGCVFAPYFCHEQGATHFAAIHKVFGASNVSKLLAHLPVVNLQTQLASMREQAAQCIINTSNTANPNDRKFSGESTHSTNFPLDLQSWWQSFQNQPRFDENLDNNLENMGYNYANGNMNPNPCVKYENSCFPEENTSFGSMDSLEMQSNNSSTQWSFQDDCDDLRSVAFRYIRQS
ncbi:hypothetical protein BUALT_Bualt02G0207000 [Buddleja alternifolia]|uniref:LOB domain-containing protein n=1 Tax=Buddleja alternifolia TaxID=168488 RepID=A0AAV6YCL7_9LAMI|nr:hypothetical protein BUALT_Bualt02G0207000 [Buddleja alternifolia]